MVQTISSPLCDPIPFYKPILKVNLTITINKDGNYAFSKYSNEKGDFITVNINPRVIFRYISEDGQWESNHQIIVNQRNIFNLRLGFKKFYQNFQKDDIFKYDEFGRLTELLATATDALVIPLNTGQLMRLEPTVITDEKNKIYPGVLMVINKESNRVPLTVDEFEMIYDTIININIHQSGLTLLQTYIGMTKVSVETTMDTLQGRNAPKTNKPQSSKSLYDLEDNDNNEGIVSGTILPKKPTTLDDL